MNLATLCRRFLRHPLRTLVAPLIRRRITRWIATHNLPTPAITTRTDGRVEVELLTLDDFTTYAEVLDDPTITVHHSPWGTTYTVPHDNALITYRNPYDAHPRSSREELGLDELLDLRDTEHPA